MSYLIRLVNNTGIMNQVNTFWVQLAYTLITWISWWACALKTWSICLSETKKMFSRNAPVKSIESKIFSIKDELEKEVLNYFNKKLMIHILTRLIYLAFLLSHRKLCSRNTMIVSMIQSKAIQETWWMTALWVTNKRDLHR